MEYKAKILIVEDTEEWQSIFKENLERQGYRIKVASSYSEANYILGRQSFDVAIVDIRLSEGDSQNQDGMRVLDDIRSLDDTTSIIIVSGYATVGLTRDAFIKYKVLDFLEKDLVDLETFIKLVERGTQAARDYGYGVKSLTKTVFIETGLSYNEISSIPDSSQNFEGLLQNMFMELWPLDKDSLGTSLLIETTKGEHIAQIVGWSKGIGEAIVVRIGSKNVIKKESQNYAKHKLGTLIKSSKKKPFHKAGLWGLVYILTNARFELLQDFTSFYENEDSSRVIEALNNLFWNSCTKIYIDRGIDKVKVDLSSMYKSVIDQLVAYREQELKEDQLYLSEMEDADRQTYLQKYDPIEFVQKQNFVFESAVGIIHGNLHTENIIVDSSAQTWLVGFYDTGLSDVSLTESDQSDSITFRAHQAGKRNLLHDFATMEVSIRKRLTNINSKKIEAFDLALCQPKQLGELLQVTFDVPELDKAYQVITRLRELALEILADFEIDVHLYYTELMFQFLDVYLHTPDRATKNQVWATVSSLIKRLNHED